MHAYSSTFFTPSRKLPMFQLNSKYVQKYKLFVIRYPTEKCKGFDNSLFHSKLLLYTLFYVRIIDPKNFFNSACSKIRSFKFYSFIIYYNKNETSTLLQNLDHLLYYQFIIFTFLLAFTFSFTFLLYCLRIFFKKFCFL